MPFVIERPVLRGTHPASGLPYVRVEVVLTVAGTKGPRPYTFILDTGSAVTTIGEDVAVALGLPTTGREVGVNGATGGERGQLVPVRFQFPPETDDQGVRPTRPGLEVTSTWVVLPNTRATRPRRALLGFQEFHDHFCLHTTPDNLYLIRWSELPPG